MPASRSDSKSSPVQLIPLGGEQEIGKNTWAFRYEDDIILLDAGLAFPDENMHGVNIVLPDMTYIKQNRDKLRGMVVTHGHEDHIGGIPYHLMEFDIPVIYGPKLALALLREKLKEVGLLNRTELRTVEPRQIVPLSKNFFVEFIRNTHSFADSFTVALHTPAGVVIQTGDFKIDHTPVDGEHFDLQRLAEHGEKGVLCLISDSTNAEVPGYTPSERAVLPGLTKAISEAKGRVIITTFASSVHRLNIILQVAEQQGRYVSLLGRSMLNVVAHARQLGYIRCKDETLQPMQSINQMDDGKTIILTTGSQGEPLAALTRIARGEHPQLEIRPGDTVIFSANPIPGNTIAVTRVIDKLMSLGAHVVYGKDKMIHVSGHGCQEEQKLMLALTRPQFFVPTHGEYRMLVKHAETAMSMGMPRENIVIINNGDVVEVRDEGIAVVDKVTSGVQLMDNSRSGVVLNQVLEERQQVASDGMLMVAVSLDAHGSLLFAPQMQKLGLVGNTDFLARGGLREIVEKTLASSWSDFARSLEKGTLDVDWAGLQDALERAITKLVRQRLQGKPTVAVMLQHPPSTAKAKSSAPEPSESDVESNSANGRTRKRRAAAAVAS
ncbi:MAG: ribonuclease J [Synechococcaceae cyanobacterium SM2_3_1]|nr:ribonuclease J [Synechococcaceae cyanobacterium SM2_3_1]